MAGLTSLLNIAKVGLLTHQTNLHVTGHNVSNVNTKGYSRQNVTLASRIPTPMDIGPIGNGVEATDIFRDYDRFITMTLFNKTSVMTGFETKQAGMKLIEGVFNEVKNNGLDELLNQFWAAWDDIANNAEGIAERTNILQKASLLVQGLHDRYNSLLKMSQDINLNVETSVKDINRLTDQIAELNVQVLSLESSRHKANDLRDQRDELLRRLSELIDVHYFETKRGTYTVLIGQGSPLIEGNRAWHLEARSGEVRWISSDGRSVKLTADDIGPGELGGWLDIKDRISPRDLTMLTGSQVNTVGGQAIKGNTALSNIDGVTVTGPFTIDYSGTNQDGLPVTGTYDSTVDYDGNGTTGTVSDFMAAVENDPAFGGLVQVSLSGDGRLILNDLRPGDFPISFQIENVSSGVLGLNLGKFDGTYPLNYLEQFNKWGAELIKAVNSQHTQGVGLVPFQETSAANSVIDASQPISRRASGLEFSAEVQDGSFEIWLYDSDGQVIDYDPATPLINEPVVIDIIKNTTTLDDIQTAINAIPGLTASIPGGTLVINVDGSSSIAGFAFGCDTSGALMDLGLNSFFTGHDAVTIGVKQDLIEDSRLIAAARIQSGGSAVAVSADVVRDAMRPLGISVRDGAITIDLYDVSGVPDHSEIIPIDADVTSLNDVIKAINNKEGLEAVMEDGLVRISATEDNWTITVNDSGNQLLDFLGITPMGLPQKSVASTYLVDRSFEPFSSYDTGVVTGTFQIDLMDADGNITSSPIISLTPDALGRVQESLQDIADQIDAFSDVTAEVIDGRLRVTAQGGSELLIFENDNTGLLEFLGLSTPMGGEMSLADNLNALTLRDVNRLTISNLNDTSLSEAYQGLVGTIGIHSRGFQLDYDFSSTTVNELQARRDEVSGVSLDEEMANLVKFQHAYSAAAKLISVADEMFLTLLDT